jgi:ribosomal protein S18 acetylase RimI-like enzyme
MDVTVRAVSRKDIDSLLQLWKEFMSDTNSLDRPIPTHAENVGRWKEFINRLIDDDPGQIQVADQDGILVGYLICQKTVTTPLDMGYKWSYISDLYVRPTHRRRGIGRRLLQTTLEYLKSIGSEHIRLAVWHRNEEAIRLYRELGFREHMYILKVDSRSHHPNESKE